MSERVCANCGGVVDPVTGVCEACATQALSVDATRRGTQTAELPEISGYRMLAHLGEGGMGSVYLAEETALGRRVAIKIISQRIVDDARSKARFAREARTLATIEHPNVVRIYSYGEAAGHPYLAMEFIEGETLGDRLQRSGVLGVDESLRIVRQIVEALEAAWEQRVVHRDMKPSNVLIDRRGRVHVADFGLAKPIDAAGAASPEYSLTEAGLVVGTPHYLPPEQAQGLPSDHRSDIYSVGLLLYQMLAGERPFDASSPFEIIAKQLREPLPPLRDKRPDVPERVAALVGSMTNKAPAQRPQTHREILDRIDALIGTTPAPDAPTLTVRPHGAHTMIGWWQSFAIIGATIAVVALASWFFAFRQPRRDAGESHAPLSSFIVAIAPFYGPDEDSVKEGRVMAALVERAVSDRLGGSAHVVGIEETKEPVRSNEQAKTLGEKLGASAVIWGEAFTLRGETEIEPHVTVIARAQAAEKSDPGATPERRVTADDVFSGRGAETVKLQASAPNQIELRKMSAAGVGDLVVLLAAIHQLERENEPAAALALLRQIPRTPQTMRYEVRALIAQDDRDGAMNVLDEIVAADPSDVDSLALIGDLHAARGSYDRAAAAFRAAEATGRPFSTKRAMLFEGRLYLKETYRPPGGAQEWDTGALLVIDPVSGVVERRHVIGEIGTLQVKSGVLEVRFNSGAKSAPTQLASFRGGAPVRDIPLPTGFRWRFGQLRSGSVLPSNFTEEVTGIRDYGEPGGEFRLTDRRYPGLPETLPELERALRLAFQKDPTQPWHLLWLAVVLDRLGRHAEADAVMSDLSRREFPGIAYYVYSPMANQLERLKKYAWADLMYARAEAERRRLRQPPSWSTLIDRLVSAAPRQAALNREPERGYEVLLWARRVAGVTFEGEDIAAILWSRYFEAKGNFARAGQERALARVVLASPLSMTRIQASIRYSVLATLSAVAAFLLLFGLLVGVAFRDARRSSGPPPRITRAEWRIWVVLVTVGVAALAYVSAYLLAVESEEVPLYGVAALCAAIGALAYARVSPRRLFAEIPVRARWLLCGVYVLALVCALLVELQIHAARTASMTPLGMADAQDNPDIVRVFDDALLERPGDPTRYAAAVVHHWARDWDRAGALYSSLPPDHPGVAANVAALHAKAAPAAPLSQSDVYDALRTPFRPLLTGGAYDDVFAEYGMKFENAASMRIVAFSLVGFPLILFALLFVVPEKRAEPATARSSLAALLVPGLDAMERGKEFRACAAVVSFAFTVAGAVLLAYFFFGAGPSARWIHSTDWNFAIPFPAPNGAELSMGDRVALLFAPVQSRIWWALVVFAAATFATLHGAAVARVMRDRRRAAVPTTPAPAPA